MDWPHLFITSFCPGRCLAMQGPLRKKGRYCKNTTGKADGARTWPYTCSEPGFEANYSQDAHTKLETLVSSLVTASEEGSLI